MTYFTTGAQLQAALTALPATKTGNFVAFNAFFYGQQYMAAYAGTLSPIEHFVQIGADRGYKPNATFDPTYYKNAFADLKNTNLNAADLLYHFMRYGLDEGRTPNTELATFNGAAYLVANPDVAAYVNANLAQFNGSVSNGALAHYVKFGAAEGRAAPGTSVSNGDTFTLTASATSADEGTTATFELTTTNVAEGTEVAYTLTGIDAADLASGALTGKAVVDAAGKATISVALAADATTEGAETLTVALDGKSVTAQTTVNDTSVAPAPVLAIAASAASVDEGSAVTFSITNGAANTEYAVKIEGVQAGDVTGDLLRLVTTDANGSATVTVNVVADSTTEGAETMTASLVGQTVSASVTINDTSVNTPPVVTADQVFTINEGSPADAAIGAVAAVDAQADAIIYAIASGNGDGYFAIDSATGALSLTAAGAAAIDAESATTAYTLGVVATDALGNASAATNVTINVGDISDTAPVAIDATGTTTEAGAVVTGTLTATDADAVDAGMLGFTLDAAVDGLTLNADGSYSFDPSLNPAAQALTYTDLPLPIVANYTVTDTGGNTDQGTLTITVTPKPLTFTIVPSATYVEEGQTISYKLVASEAVQTEITGSIQVTPGDGTAGKTAANDFGSGALNPQNVTIAVGQTESTLFNLIPQNDAATEVPESYTAKATVTGYTIADVTGEVRDPSTIGGVGQTFTLTTSQDTVAGTSGNDTIKGIYGGATGDTVTAGDSVDGGAGTDTLELTAQGTAASPAAFVVKNVETISIRDLVGATFNALSVENTPAINFTDTVAGQTSTVTNAALASVVGLSGKGNVTVDYAVTSGTADTANLSLAGAGTSATVRSTANVADGNTVEAVAIATSGTNFVTLQAGTAAGTVTITGNGTNDIVVGSIKSTATIDASASTGTNTIDLGTGLSNGDAVKGGTGADTVKFNATAAIGTVTFTGVETLTADFDTDVTLNLGTSTGITTLNNAGSSGSATITNAAADLTTVNITSTATADTDNDFSLSYKTGAVGAPVVNIGSTAATAANITMDDFSFTRVESLAINAVGTKDNTIGDVAVAASTDVAFSSNVAADGYLDLQYVDAASFGGITVAVAESGYFSAGGFSAASGGAGDVSVTVAANGVGVIGDLQVSGDIGNMTMTLGSGASGYIDASTSGYFSAGEGGDVGDINVTMASGATGTVYGYAYSGSVGDVNLTGGANGSAYVSVYASAYSGAADDDYLGGGNIGNITVNATGTSGSAYVYASAYVGYPSGNTGEGGNIGNLTLNVNGNGASGYIDVSGGSGGSVGDIAVTVEGSGFAYVSADSYENLSAGGNIGNTVITTGDDAYVVVDLDASGSIGTQLVTAGDSTYVSVYVMAYSGSIGDVAVTMGDDSTYSGNFSAGSGSVGNVNVTLGSGAYVNVDVSAGDTAGTINVTVGEGSDVDVTTQSDTGAGAVTIAGGATADNADFDAWSSPSLDSINMAGWLGTYTIDTQGVTAGTTIYAGKAGGTINAGDAADVIYGGDGADIIYASGGTDSIVAGKGADSIYAGAGVDTIDLTEATAAVDTVYILAAADGNDVITGFTAGAGGDVINTTAIVDLADSVATGLTVASDFGENNVFIFNGTATTIAAAAAAIAADADVVATVGYIVIKDSANGDKVTVFHSTDLGVDGTETAIATLVGVDITALTSANFAV
jgi:hypothetical protein